MAETHQYVNRSNLATFLAKIKELIPSSLTFLTKTEAEETYQEKLEGYTERINEHSGALDITIDAKDGDDGNGLLTVGAGDLLINTRSTATGSGVVVNLNGGGQFRLNNGQGFIYNGSYVLTRSDVVDGLTSELEDRPLSANQGRVLNEKISDILTKSDVVTDTDVAMLSRMFALPLSSYVGAGLYQPSTDTIGKYTEMFNSLADGELVVCEYQGVKGLYKYQGGSQLYCFSQWAADLTKIPTGVEDSLTSSSTGKALSANQGMVLNGKIADLQSDVSSLENQFTNQVWIMRNTTTNPISRSLLYPQAGNPAVGDVILGIDYHGDRPVTPFVIIGINGDDITYTIITEIVSS